MKRGWRHIRYIGSSVSICLPIFWANLVNAQQESAGLPQLDTTWFPSQVLWTSITMGAMILLAKYIFIPRVKSIKDKRKNHTDTILNKVEILQQKITTLNTEIHDLKEAHKRAMKTMQAEKQAQEKEAQDSLNEAIKMVTEEKQEELRKDLEKLQNEMEMSWENNVQQMAEKIARLALEPHAKQKSAS